MQRDPHTAWILARFHHERLLAEAERERQSRDLLQQMSREPGPQEAPLRQRLLRWPGRRRPVL